LIRGVAFLVLYGTHGWLFEANALRNGEKWGKVYFFCY